jgi:shikimate dehydrogenase
MTPAAEAIGAVNLLWFGAGGTEADNTDAPGTAAALRDIAGVPFAGKRVFVLGAGGSGRAAAYGLLKEGAGEVIFGVRNPEKSKDIVGRFRRSLPNDQIETLDLGASNAREQLEKRLAEVDIIINATPAGMTGHGEGPLIDAGSAIHDRHCCFDFVYQQRETSFLKTARRGGAKTVEGLALLVAQAQAAFKVWTGVEFSLRDMFEATARHAADFESVRGA